MRSTLRLLAVLSLILISFMSLELSMALADHQPMPKNVGLSTTALPDLSKLKLEEAKDIGMGVMRQLVRDPEGNLVGRVYSMPWEPEKNMVFEWRIAVTVPIKDNPANWDWQFWVGFENGPIHEADAGVKFSDITSDPENNLMAVTVSVLKEGKVVGTKTFTRPADKK